MKLEYYLQKIKNKLIFFFERFLDFSKNQARKKKISLTRFFFYLSFLVLCSYTALFALYILLSLPSMINKQDYKPYLLTEVFDRNGVKIGEFFKQKRTLISAEKIPENIKNAFVAAEDDEFFTHHGINLKAILRAFIANIKAGKKIQGASTITQQVARSLVLTREKTYTRKIKEILMALKMERLFSKQDILFIYLNEIYLGHGAYGIATASQIYFQKDVSDLNLPEAAMIAGLAQAPSRYSPVYNSKESKKRQIYVLERMLEQNYITQNEFEKAIEENIIVNKDVLYQSKAPYYMETIRQLLVKKLGEDLLLTGGLKIYTGLDMDKQIKAQESLMDGLRDLSRRRGYRGPQKNLIETSEIHLYLEEVKNKLINEKLIQKTILADGTYLHEREKAHWDPKKGDSFEAVVSMVDDEKGLVFVFLPQGEAIIDFETMKWARKPDQNVLWKYAEIHKASEALKKGDVISVRLVDKTFTLPERLMDLDIKEKKEILSKNYMSVELDQAPETQAALFSIDQNTEEIVAFVGGKDFKSSKFNRILQALRQTGSAFKPIVYLAALERAYKPNSILQDVPKTYQEKKEMEEQSEEADETEEVSEWTPQNHSQKYRGDILFRNALISSLNVPTIRLIEKIGVNWVKNYAKRLGIFSPLNEDYTLALGSSGISLYEMTKVFSQIGRNGKKVSPIIVKKVVNLESEVLLENLSLDEYFEKKLSKLDEFFEEKRKSYLEKYALEENSEEESEKQSSPFYFTDPDQLISPQTAYLMSDILKSVVEHPRGTGKYAQNVGHPVAGKTGTTDGYYDAWFLGYSYHLATGVWVGFDQEKSLGLGEVGGRSALPIWTDYMRKTHTHLEKKEFNVPEKIIFVNIDEETGLIAHPSSEKIVRSAFKEGDEPKDISEPEIQRDFFKEDLSE